VTSSPFDKQRVTYTLFLSPLGGLKEDPPALPLNIICPFEHTTLSPLWPVDPHDLFSSSFFAERFVTLPPGFISPWFCATLRFCILIFFLSRAHVGHQRFLIVFEEGVKAEVVR